MCRLGVGALTTFHTSTRRGCACSLASAARHSRDWGDWDALFVAGMPNTSAHIWNMVMGAAGCGGAPVGQHAGALPLSLETFFGRGICGIHILGQGICGIHILGGESVGFISWAKGSVGYIFRTGGSGNLWDTYFGRGDLWDTYLGRGNFYVVQKWRDLQHKMASIALHNGWKRMSKGRVRRSAR
eukprot:352209-Chlamydomonas_euryale.AAC.7